MSETLEVFGLTLSTMSEEEAAEQEVKEREEELSRRREKLLEHYRSEASGVPRRYWNESLATYQGEAVSQVMAFTKKKSGILLLCGAPGTGKTHLGCGVIRECGGYYTTLQRLLYEVDSTMSFKAKETKIQLLDRVCSYDTLVLDEVMRGVREDALRELAVFIISEFYANMKKLVIIGNPSKMEFVAWLGLAAKDRLNEMAEVIEFKCESFRPKKRTTFLKG